MLRAAAGGHRRTGAHWQLAMARLQVVTALLLACGVVCSIPCCFAASLSNPGEYSLRCHVWGCLIFTGFYLHTTCLSLKLPCGSAAGVAGRATMPKGAMLWVYRCDDNATSWRELVQYLGDVAKPAGVTSVSLCAYRIKADGSFGYRA